MNLKKTILVGIILSSLGCIKQPEFDDDDGPVASAQAVTDAVVDAWGTADAADIRKDEFSYSELSQRIQGVPAYDPAKVMYLEGLTVTDRQVTSDGADYKVVHQVSDRTGTESKVSSTEYQFSVKNPTPQEIQPQSLMKLYEAGEIKPMSLVLGVDIAGALAMACHKRDDWDEDCAAIKADKCELTCHNLVVSLQTLPAPELVRARPNCEGLPNCQMRVVKVSFDQLLKITRGSTTEKSKVSYSAMISADVPYLSRMISQCSRRLLTVSASNQKVLGEVCNEVRDFKAGTPH